MTQKPGKLGFDGGRQIFSEYALCWCSQELQFEIDKVAKSNHCTASQFEYFNSLSTESKEISLKLSLMGQLINLTPKSPMMKYLRALILRIQLLVFLKVCLSRLSYYLLVSGWQECYIAWSSNIVALPQFPSKECKSSVNGYPGRVFRRLLQWAAIYQLKHLKTRGGADTAGVEVPLVTVLDEDYDVECVEGSKQTTLLETPHFDRE
jgi:hypothetical protein